MSLLSNLFDKRAQELKPLIDPDNLKKGASSPWRERTKVLSCPFLFKDEDTPYNITL